MRYTSTRDPTLNVSFERALTSGYAPDGGLFVPAADSTDWSRLQLDGPTLRSWQALDYPTLMYQVLRRFIDVTEVPDEALRCICRAALDGFRDPGRAVPLVELRCGDDDDAFFLTIAELFHGPTFCFKDLGMRAVLGLLQHFGRQRQRTITLLVSTTGDTGPAAARAVADQEAQRAAGGSVGSSSSFLKLAVHYPHGQISNFQRRQMTCLDAPNDVLQVIAFEGGGDDMDAPIKAFLQHPQDDENPVVRAGVNSYNIGRPLTQMVIYIWSYLRMAETYKWNIPDDLSTIPSDNDDNKEDDAAAATTAMRLDVILPTGAMGNVTAAYLTKLMGLPLGRLYNAVNANDITDRVMRCGDFGKAKTMIRTLSEAINIQVPYNFERILYYITNGDAAYVKSFYEDQPEDARQLDPTVHLALTETFASVSISDDEMKAALRRTYEMTATTTTQHQQQRYLCDPHTAVALAGVYKLGLARPQRRRNRRPLLVMATASPCKFQAAVTAAVGEDAWNAYAATEPALLDLADSVDEKPPLIYRWVEGATLAETQAHWQTLLAGVLRRLEGT